jgi:hypothetical protein
MKNIPIIILFWISLLSYAEVPQWIISQPIVDNYVLGCAQQVGGNNLDRIKKYSRLLSEDMTEYTDAYNSSEVGAKRYSLFFDGVIVKGFHIPGKIFLLQYVEITTPEFNFLDGIGVGRVEKELVNYFKSAGIKDGNKISFSGESEYVVFTITDSVVTKVQLYVYTG